MVEEKKSSEKFTSYRLPWVYRLAFISLTVKCRSIYTHVDA